MGIHCTVRETDSIDLWVMVSTAPSYTTVPLQVAGLYSACLSISSHQVNCQLTFLWKCVEPLLESQIKRSIRSFHPAYRKQLKTKSLQSLTCTWQYARHSEVQIDKQRNKKTFSLKKFLKATGLNTQLHAEAVALWCCPLKRNTHRHNSDRLILTDRFSHINCQLLRLCQARIR